MLTTTQQEQSGIRGTDHEPLVHLRSCGWGNTPLGHGTERVVDVSAICLKLGPPQAVAEAQAAYLLRFYSCECLNLVATVCRPQILLLRQQIARSCPWRGHSPSTRKCDPVDCAVETVFGQIFARAWPFMTKRWEEDFLRKSIASRSNHNARAVVYPAHRRQLHHKAGRKHPPRSLGPSVGNCILLLLVVVANALSGW